MAFDIDSYLAEDTTQPSQQKKATEAFDIDAFLAEDTPKQPQQMAAAESFDIDAYLDKPEEEGSPGLVSKPITEQEINLIAKKYGADPQRLRKHALVRGAVLSDATPEEDVGAFVTSVANQVAMKVPTKLAALAEDDNTEKAIDELQELIDQKSSTVQKVGEFGAGVLAPGLGIAAKGVATAGKAATAAQAALKAGGAGAVESGILGGLAGFGDSKSGDEVMGTITGAGLGVAFGGALTGALGGITRRMGLKAEAAAARAAGEAAEGADDAAKAGTEAAEAAADAGETAAEAAGATGRVADDATRAANVEALGPTGEDLLAKAAARVEAKSEENGSVLESIIFLAEDVSTRTGEVTDEGVRNVARDLINNESVADTFLQALGFVEEGSDKVSVDKAVYFLVGEMKQFAYHLTGATPEQIIRGKKVFDAGAKISSESSAVDLVLKKLEELGPKGFLDEYKSFKMLQELPQVAKESSALLEKTGAMEAMAPAWLRAFRYVGQEIDKRLPGLNVVDIIDRGSSAKNYSTLLIAKWLDDANAGLDIWNKLPTKAEQDLVYLALDTGKMDGLSEEGKESVRLLKGWFEASRQDANNRAGREIIKFREHYVQNMAKPKKEGVPAIEGALAALKQRGLNLLDDQTSVEEVEKWLAGGSKKGEREEGLLTILRSISYYADKDSSEGAYWITKEVNGKKLRVLDLDAIRQDMRQLRTLEEGLNGAERLQARALMARDGDIPKLIRDKDLNRIAKSWTTSVSRQIYIEPIVAELRQARSAALALGDRWAAEKLTTMLQDVTGAGRDTWGNKVQRTMDKWAMKALETSMQHPEGSKKKVMFEYISDFPLVINGLVSNLYPAFLGMFTNFKASLVNLTQPLFSTLPEAGIRYGTTKTLAAYYNVLADIWSGKFKALVQGRIRDMFSEDSKLTQILESKGLKGASRQALTSQEAVSSRILDRNPKMRHVTGFISKANEAQMLLFSASEDINRGVAMYIGRSIADDIIKLVNGELQQSQTVAGKAMRKAGLDRVSGLKSYMNSLDDSVKRKVLAAAKAGDAETVRDIMERHVVAKTIMNYDQFNQAEAARYLGPMFSQFTRFPTAMAGEVMEGIQSAARKDFGKARNIAVKLLGPLGFALMLNASISPEDRKYLGEAGFKKFVPLLSVESFISGKAATPPVVQAVFQPLYHALNGDLEKAGAAFKNTTVATLPLIPAFMGIYDSLYGDDE